MLKLKSWFCFARYSGIAHLLCFGMRAECACLPRKSTEKENRDMLSLGCSERAWRATEQALAIGSRESRLSPPQSSVGTFAGVAIGAEFFDRERLHARCLLPLLDHRNETHAAPGFLCELFLRGRRHPRVRSRPESSMASKKARAEVARGRTNPKRPAQLALSGLDSRRDR